MITIDTPVTVDLLGFHAQPASAFGGGVNPVSGAFASGVLQTVSAFGSLALTSFTAMSAPAYGAGIVRTAGNFAGGVLQPPDAYAYAVVATPVRLEVFTFYDNARLASANKLVAAKGNYSFWS